MGLKFARKKERNWLVTICYRLHRLLPLSSTKKLKLYLNLEWMFDRLAHEMSFKYYAPDKHPFRESSKKFLLLEINNNRAVLDLGCNRGEISSFLSQNSKFVVGIDQNITAIDYANEHYKRDNLSFVCADAFDYLNRTNEKFDTLILSHILEHIEEPESFLKKYTSFFDRIYIELPDFDRYYLNKYRTDLNLSLTYTDNDHVSEFDRYELMEIIDKCGLEIIRSEYIFGLQKIWCKRK